MNISLIFALGAGFVILCLRKTESFLPRHFSSREEISNSSSYDNTTSDREKYLCAFRKALDMLWTLKSHVINGREFYRRIRIIDGTEIEYLAALFDELQSYMNLVADIVVRVLESSSQIAPEYRIHPLNKTIADKLLADWKEIKGHVDKYKPEEAVEEYKKLCAEVDGAIRDLPIEYKPVYELMAELQNETYPNGETTVISLMY